VIEMKKILAIIFAIIFTLLLIPQSSAGMSESEYLDEIATSSTVMSIILDEYSDAINDYADGYDTKSECLDRISWCSSETTSEYNRMNSISPPSKYSSVHTHYVNALYYYVQAMDYAYDGILYDNEDYLNTAIYYMNLGIDEIEAATDEMNALQKHTTYHKSEEPDYTWIWGTCCVSIFIIIAVLFGGMYFKHRHEKSMEEQMRYKVPGAAVAEHVCPVCGAKVSDFSLFCPECGEKVDKKMLSPKETPDEGKLYCPACGFENKGNNVFCEKCGAKLTEERWRQSQQTIPSVETPVERETEPITFEPDKELKLIKVRCPVCKHEMEVEDTGRPLRIVCEKCGAKGTLR